MPKLITVTEFVRTFSEIISLVHYRGEEFDIKKGTNIVARLSPIKARNRVTTAELNNLFRDAPHLSIDDIENFTQDIAKVKALNDIGGVDKWD